MGWDWGKPFKSFGDLFDGRGGGGGYNAATYGGPEDQVAAYSPTPQPSPARLTPQQQYGDLANVQFDQAWADQNSASAAGDQGLYARTGTPTDLSHLFGGAQQSGGYAPGQGPASGSQQTGGLGGGGWTDPGHVADFMGYGPRQWTGYTMPGSNYGPNLAPGPASSSQQTWGLGGGQGVYSNMGGGRGG